jgi:hypothetical protein
MISLPPYLRRFEIWLGDVLLDCWLDFEPSDPSTGQNAVAHLIHAYVGTSGMDIVSLMSEAAVCKVQDEAAIELDREY